MKLLPPSPKQRVSMLQSTRRLNIWDGAVRASKTVASLIRWLRYVDVGPPGELMMMAKTERTLLRNVLHPIVELLEPGEFRINLGAGEAELWGRRIYLAGANDERSETKIRGVTLAGAYGDELTTWPESVFRMLLSRLSVTGAQFFGTTNPDAKGHWLNRGFLARAGELDLARFHFTIDDNPFLDPAFVANLKSEYTGLWYQRFILGEWVVAEGAVYDMLDEDVHLVDELPELVDHWVGIDEGTTNPTVFLMLSLGVDGCLYAHSEWRGRGKSPVAYSRALRTWLAARREEGREPRWIYVDPAAAHLREQFRADGITNVAAASNTVLRGIAGTSSLFAVRRLKLHRPTTAATWDELTGYVWDAKKQAKGEDAPLKVDDHGPDALRYAVRGSRSTWRRWLTTADQDDEEDDDGAA